MRKDHLDWGVRTYFCLSDNLVNSALKNPSYGTVSYTVTVENLTGYLESGSKGINHGKGLFVTPSLCPNLSFMRQGSLLTVW